MLLRKSQAVSGLFPAIFLAALLLPQDAQAAGLPANATVTVDERGFLPLNVTIAVRGSVTWQNTGTTSHVVETGSAPLQINLGVDTGKSATWAFGIPGVYHYSSATDCQPTVTKALFKCLDYTVTVLDEPPGSLLPTSQASPTPSTTAPPSTGAGQQLTVTITDSGISPATATIPAGGTVIWLNQGFHIHTATSPPGTQSFDTGGLATGQASIITFPAPGRYTYTSAVDCLGGGSGLGFDCGPYTLVVSAETWPPATPTPGAVGAIAPASNTTISIDDSKGFLPSVLTIKLGQSVTWLNKGNNVHAAVTDPGVIPAFDSGGIGAGQSVTWTPTASGQYGYHSPPDASYFTSTGCNCPASTYGLFSGTLVVGP